MAGEDLDLDGRDLPAAALDSFRFPPTLLSDLVEGASIALQSRLLSRKALPARHGDVDVFGVEFEAVTNAPRRLRGCEGRSAPEEGIVNHLAAFGVV
jgi:hypothetical protein